MRFVGLHAALATEVASEQGRALEDDRVVDTDAWGLADPVGICAAELAELRAQIEKRVAELP